MFKRINDMTDAELLDLTNDQVRTLIDYECALAGVPLLPPEPVKPSFDKPKPDMEVYEISCSVYFTDAAQVAQILNMMNRSNKVGYNHDYGKTGLTHAVNEISVYQAPKYEAKLIYSQNLFESVKEQAEQVKQAENTYNAEKKAWDSAFGERKDIIKMVNDNITKAADRKREWDKHTGLFDRYVALAGGNKETAWTFLVAAYPDVEYIEGFKESVHPQEDENGNE